MHQGKLVSVNNMVLDRLIRISEAVHADVNAGNKWLEWLLGEAKCDCEQCKKRRTESG